MRLETNEMIDSQHVKDGVRFVTEDGEHVGPLQTVSLPRGGTWLSDGVNTWDWFGCTVSGQAKNIVAVMIPYALNNKKDE